LLNVGTVIRIVAQHLLVHLQALEDAVRVTRGAWNIIQFRVAIESSPNGKSEQDWPLIS
jgi:hypothetical protein